MPSGSAVTSFTLINALNEQEVMTLENGANIDINDLPTNQLNIRANVSGTVESVTFQITGAINETSTESTPPYALFGDNAGNYFAQTFTTGDYTVTARPYTLDNAQGQVGTSLSISFTINNGSGGSTNNPPVVTNPGNQTNAESDNISLPINANDGDTDQTQGLTYSASGLPPGLSINPNTGLITGTIQEPTTSGGSDGAFQENNGLLVVEAESSPINNGWVRKTEGGETFYEATSNHFNSINTSTNLDYSIRINTPGIYRVIWRSKINVGTNATEHNDNWLKLPNNNDVTFFAYKGTPFSEATLQSALNSNNVLYPKGSGLSPNPAGGGASGFFKIYMNSLSGWQWRAVTSDHNPHDIYVKFDKAGTYTLQMSSRSAGHAIEKLALYRVDTYGYNYNGNLNLLTNLAESSRTDSGTPGASADSPYNVTVTVTDNGSPARSSSVNFTWFINETNSENPLPPTNLRTSQITSSSLLLSWTGSSFGDAYIIEQSTEPNSGFSKIATVNYGTNQTQVSGLLANTTYYFRAYTEAQGITSAVSSTVSATTTTTGSGISVVNLTLIDADKNVELGLLSEGDTVNYAEIGTKNISVRANTNPGIVGSVRFAYDNNPSLQLENLAPYAIQGDAGGKYNPWTPALGQHRLVVTPYSASSGGGTAGAPLTVNFVVVDQEGNIDPNPGQQPPVLSGEFKKWHKLTISFFGPQTSEQASDNPFLNYRLNVTFTNGSKTYVVPGYFAADGQAGESSASSGNIWKVHFTPDEIGQWSFSASFRKGNDIAISDNPNAGTAVDFNGQNGTFNISASDKNGKDFRARGRLNYVNEHYLQFEETGEYFLKGGADSPENFLAYKEFDGTYNHGGVDYTKTYSAHIQDWTNDSPTWQSGKGRGIIGSVNYLASKGMNSVYFLTMNVNGDGKDVWPWTSHTERYRFDVSKLDQWEVVFSHMEKLGIMMHVLTQETENDRLLDGGYLGTQRKLYYRELIARFGHHLAINWNLGEENDIHQELPDPTNAQLKAYATYFKNTDPYQSYINVHTYPGQYDDVYDDLIGYPDFDGASLQIGGVAAVHTHVTNWVNKSAASGRKWVVNLDEIGPATTGVKPDADDFWHNDVRKQALWGALMGGAGGVEWYFGYQYAHSDLNCEDWRSRDNMWNLTRYAIEFFQSYVPYWNMSSNDGLTSDSDDYCYANPGEAYLIYLPNGGSTNLNFGTNTGNYSVLWLNPRTGQTVQDDNITVTSTKNVIRIGDPPSSTTSDWAVLIRRDDFIIANQSAQSHMQEVDQTVFPNPASYHANFIVDMAQTGDVRIKISSMEYLVIDKIISNVPAGEQTITIETSTIADGAYTYTVSYPGVNGTETKSGRLLIQH